MNDASAPSLAALIDQLEAALQAARAGRQSPTELAAGWRAALATAPAALPPRYRDVAGQLLSQVESSALFGDESCSFSRADLLDALADWLAHARRLPPA